MQTTRVNKKKHDGESADNAAHKWLCTHRPDKGLCSKHGHGPVTM